MSDTIDMTIAEDSYYDHPEYGRVRLVNADAETVRLECQERMTHVPGGSIPTGVTESRARFERLAEPADITVDAPAASSQTATPTPGGGE